MKLARYLIFALAIVSLWMAYDNVFADDTAVRVLAEQTACKKKNCNDRHPVVSMSKTPIGQNIDYGWFDGVVHVTCHRSAYVFGTRECNVD